MDELKVVVCGPVDAGKSSLIGVLNNGILDDGRGYSRNLVLKHEHEKSTGRTSNITVNTYCYKNNDGKLEVKKGGKLVKNVRDMSINNNDRMVNLIDLAGHERYLKTTVYGMLAYYPNYGIVVIGANTGITKLTKEHLGIMLYLNIPFSIVITKIDIAPPKIYNNLVKRLSKLLKNIGRELVFINENADEMTNEFIKNGDYSNRIPIVSVSNKTGTNLDNLHYLLNNVPIKEMKLESNTGIISIDTNFQVPGIGLIVSGTNIGERFNVKQKCYLGPVDGKFYGVTIRSIHNCLRENVNETENGGYYSFAIKFLNPKEAITRRQLRKGMVLVNSLDNGDKLVTKKFRAKVKILHHSTTIKNGYCPLIHVGPVRQSAKIEVLDKKYLNSGDSALLEFSFMYRPELVRIGQTLFFRDGSTKGVGTICELVDS
jgi:GTPase